MIEPEYEARCEHFSGDDKTINVIHENLITVCEELGLFDKASYYRSRLTEWLETKQRMCVMKEQSISIQKTFDSFIVSRSNVEAYSACVDLVKVRRVSLLPSMVRIRMESPIFCMPLKMRLSRAILICPFVLPITMM